MPRRRPDEVVTHRIELGDKERQVLEDVAKPLTYAGMAAGAGIAAAGYGAYLWLQADPVRSVKDGVSWLGDQFQRAANQWDRWNERGEFDGLISFLRGR